MINGIETSDFVRPNPFYNLPVIDLLIKQQDMESKISMASGISGADNMVQSLFNLKMQLDEEIDRRMYNGEINDSVIFIFEDYMRRKNDIETTAMNQIEEAQMQAEYGDINEAQLVKKLDEINKNKEKGLNDLVKSIK